MNQHPDVVVAISPLLKQGHSPTTRNASRKPAVAMMELSAYKRGVTDAVRALTTKGLLPADPETIGKMVGKVDAKPTEPESEEDSTPPKKKRGRKKAATKADPEVITDADAGDESGS